MRHIRTLILISLCALLACSCHKSNPIVIIPEPVECTPKHGSFTLNDETFLCFENLKGDDTELAKTINDMFRSTFGIKPNWETRAAATATTSSSNSTGKRTKTLGMRVIRSP